MAINYDNLGPLGPILRKRNEHPPGTVDIEDIKYNDEPLKHEEGKINMAIGGGRPKKWAVLKFWTQEDRKKPNKRKIEDKIKELMKKEEEKEGDLESYYKDKKRMRRLKKATSRRHERMIKRAKRAKRRKKKGGSKRTRKKRGGSHWDKMKNSDQEGYEKKKKLNERQYKYYFDYGKYIEPYHADFKITKDKNGEKYIHLNKFGKEITLAEQDDKEKGINYAISVLKELHKKNIFHGDIVSGDTDIKWNTGNILFNKKGDEYKLIDFGPTDGEKRSDGELLMAEINLLDKKIGRDEYGNLRAPPSIKKPRRPQNMYGNFSPRAPGRSFMNRLDAADKENRLVPPIISSPSSSPKRPYSQEEYSQEEYSPKRLRIGGGKRKSTKKKRKRKRKSTKKKRRRRR